MLQPCAITDQQSVAEVHTNSSSSAASDLKIKLPDVTAKAEISPPANDILFDFAQDPQTKELYLKALNEGKEEDNDIRIMVIGCHSQGKSSLVRRLTGKTSEAIDSTNGIDIHLCDKEWDTEIIDDVASDSAKRLALATKTQSTSQNKEYILSSENLPDISQNLQGLEVDTDSQGFTQTVNEEHTESHFSMCEEQASSRLLSQHVSAFGKQLKQQNATALDEKDFKINIWDFGGQFVYYSTHQLFHSKHAIYLLVFNLALGLDVEIKDDDCPNRIQKRTMKDYLKFWVNSVHTFVGNEQGTEPPILLVGTHLDKLEAYVDVDECFEDVRKLFEDSTSAYHIRPENFAISNTQPCFETLQEVRKTIIKVVTEQSARHIIPARWIPLERSLKENSHLKIISFDMVKEVDSKNEVSIDSDEQLKLFLQYHHDKGTFFYFENTQNEINHVVLEPRFLIDAFKCIITAEKFCRVNPKLRKLWRRLCDEAILEKELLHELWTRDVISDFMKFEKTLLYFLQKHRIFAEALQFDDQADDEHPVSLGFYIVPSLLKKSDEGMVDAFLRGRKYTNTSLGYIFQYDSILPTVYNRVTAAALGKWPVLKFQGQSVIYEHVAGCKISSHHAGLLKMTENALELLVVSLCPTDEVSPDYCDLFRRFVELIIEQELHKFKRANVDGHATQKLPMLIRCLHEEHAFKGSTEVYELETLRNHDKEKIVCPDNACHSLNIQETMKQWFKIGLFNGDIPKRQVTEKELSKLSMSVGSGWEHLARHLGIREAELDHINLDRSTTASKIYAMFSRWKNKNGESATLDVLISAVKECRMVLTVESDALKNLIDGM